MPLLQIGPFQAALAARRRAQGRNRHGLLMFAYAFLAMTAYNIIQPLTARS